LIGTAYSVLIRLELSGPGIQFIADSQLYNSIITAHAIVMIFFMVKYFKLLNINLFSTLSINRTDNNKIVIIENNNDNNYNNENNNNNNFKYKYTKILIDNPFNNRDIILRIAKKQKGVYV
jgi:hypothetical protein